MAAPTAPVPSMIPPIVDRARWFLFIILWVPKLAETEVLVTTYGASTKSPKTIIKGKSLDKSFWKTNGSWWNNLQNRNYKFTTLELKNKISLSSNIRKWQRQFKQGCTKRCGAELVLAPLLPVNIQNHFLWSRLFIQSSLDLLDEDSESFRLSLSLAYKPTVFERL